MEFNARLESTLAAMPHLTTVSPQTARQAREEGRSIFGAFERSSIAEEREIPAANGPIGIRVFPADDPQGVYLHLHGGGWVLGGTHHQDPRLEAISRKAGMTVVSVDYRLAPEHPYPAAPDDCEAAALWLAANAEREFGSGRLAIGGESAGAHLAVTTLLRMRDRHGFGGFFAANLVYGIFDLRGTPSLRSWGPRNLILDTASMQWFISHYLSGVSADDPDVSPLLADLEGLPPALFTVGTEDPLIDDTLFMHARWAAAGNQAELALYPGGCHAFDAFELQIAAEALGRIQGFLTERLAGTG